ADQVFLQVLPRGRLQAVVKLLLLRPRHAVEQFDHVQQDHLPAVLPGQLRGRVEGPAVLGRHVQLHQDFLKHGLPPPHYLRGDSGLALSSAKRNSTSQRRYFASSTFRRVKAPLSNSRNANLSSFTARFRWASRAATRSLFFVLRASSASRTRLDQTQMSS